MPESAENASSLHKPPLTDPPASVFFVPGSGRTKRGGLGANLKSALCGIVKQVKNSFLWLGPGFVILIVGTAFSVSLIPSISSRANEDKLLQELRQQRILEIGERDREFNSKLNALRVSLARFGNLPFEMKLKPDEIRREQMLFRKEYGERYIALDQIAWWWYWDGKEKPKYSSLLRQLS